MAQEDNVKILKLALILLAIMSLVYGFGFLIIPGVLVNASGGNPVDLAWLRWPGGVIFALGIGCLMVYGKPEKQGIFVTIMALSTLLSGLGMLYSWIMQEGSGAVWFTALPTIITLVISGLLWWGRGQAKDIL